ncbi:transcript variant X2 [Nothobranchius furzeri]|uniref:Transcript variant X2 n=1 Tax=Nothobranchius furzeri TaxID=105023 RepID=A0A9D2XH58_NOTFU|nr:transcript variant X2 [Nothobranchius furzeri]
MGPIQQVVFLFLGHCFAARSFGRPEDTLFPQDFGGFFDNNWLFPFDRNFDFPSFDTFFSSWRSWNPDFHMLAEFPPVVNVPRIQVFCDETKLTLLVDKNAFGLTLTTGDIQLGDGCYSNKELPNQLGFVYNLDQCGTVPLQNGEQVFTNSLHLNVKKNSPWWQTPPSIHVSCIPKRLFMDPNPVFQPEKAKTFNIQAMNPSWTNKAESNIYKRGQMINLQVSATTGPDQQLFIQSCFVSASPEAQTRPRRSVILNKGCASSLGHMVAQFVSTDRADVVNFIVNTSRGGSELYIHCSVVVADAAVTPASKSCNYNVNKSRWEELNGDVEVCGCCSSKCKGPVVYNLSVDAKAVVSVGPLVIVDDGESSPALPESEPQTFGSSLPTTMRSDAPDPADDVAVSAADPLINLFQPSPQGVVMVRQDPDATITLWLPEPVQADHENGIHQAEESLKPDEKSEMRMKSEGDSSLWDLKLLPLADGWKIPQDYEVIAGSFPSNKKFRRSGSSVTKTTPAESSLPTEVVSLQLVEMPEPVLPEHKTEWPPAKLTVGEDSSQVQMDGAVEPAGVQPVIRTKLEFSKGADGSKKLTYEEEVKQNVKTAKGKQVPKLKELLSTFLDLLRRINQAE